MLRQGINPRVLNVLNAPDVENAIAGCTHVINCLRGGDDIMLAGLRNLLDAAEKRQIGRFVHLSSVAVYGSFPPPEARDESAPTAPERGSYGWIKLQQDQMVQAAAARGLPSVILCPPNISGPASYFLLDVLNTLIRDQLLLLRDEASICCLVDVENLAHACWSAIGSEISDGRRYFVTDDELATWPQLVERVSAAGELDAHPRTISRAELAALAKPATSRKASLWRSVKHLVSSDVRSALRKDPLLEKVDVSVRRLVARLGGSMEDSLRKSIEGPTRIPAEPARRPANVNLSVQQLRGVAHSSAKIKAELGYRPLHSFAASMDAFARWLRDSRGMSDPDWELRKRLFGYR
jgi:nucleoside-diphosphate-sugar epimerase